MLPPLAVSKEGSSETGVGDGEMNDSGRLTDTPVSVSVWGRYRCYENERRRGIGTDEVKRSTRSTERLVPISVWTVAIAVDPKIGLP